MSFVVEDGTGLANANSLCSVAEADAYFADRGVSAWAGAQSLKEAALVRATDFLENRGLSFKGEKLLTTQALCFPRIDINYDSVVPPRVKYAVAEYAVRTLSGAPLNADPTVDATGRATKRVKESLEGVVSTETEYFGSGRQAVSYPAADAYLREFIRTGGRSYR